MNKVEEWTKPEIEGATLFVATNPFGGLNGYVKFPKNPLREQNYGGIATYVPVHGGITYADGKGTFGFDTLHCTDSTPSRRGHSGEKGKIWTLEEVKKETEKMARGLLLAKKYERRYLRCISSKGKAKVVDEYHKELGEQFDVTDNLGAMLNCLCGEL